MRERDLHEPVYDSSVTGRGQSSPSTLIPTVHLPTGPGFELSVIYAHIQRL